MFSALSNVDHGLGLPFAGAGDRAPFPAGLPSTMLAPVKISLMTPVKYGSAVFSLEKEPQGRLIFESSLARRQSWRSGPGLPPKPLQPGPSLGLEDAPTALAVVAGKPRNGRDALSCSICG